MMLVAYVYCSFRGYDATMFSICMAVCTYKMIDGLADVYEGRLQQMDKLYLAGISQAFRSVIVFIVFSLALLITRNLVVASIAMAVAAALTFIVLTFPLAHLETPRSRGRSFASIVALFKQCFPVLLLCLCMPLSTICLSSLWKGCSRTTTSCISMHSISLLRQSCLR